MTHAEEFQEKGNGEARLHLVSFQTALVRYSQFPTALLAAASEDFAAIFRFHALTKAMLVLACTAGRLIGAFHRLFK